MPSLRFKRRTSKVRRSNGSELPRRYSRLSTNFVSSVEGDTGRIRSRICRHHKLGAALTDAPDGIYTWMMYRDGDSFVVYAGKIRSNQEIGTLHQNLSWCAQKTVEFAGELRKTGSVIEYNLQSGTYMANKFTRFRRLLTTESKTGKALTDATQTNEARQARNQQIHEDNVRLRQIIQGQVEAIFRSIGLDPTFLEAPADSAISLIYGGLPIIAGLDIVIEEGGSTNRSLDEVYSE